ncbi:hypothetical protein F2P81_020812 [Scophthalmus maximus]|uniref:Uncharacterized protein n=1 Tax=Scophthalmus maximus TaxID=52904 RepID=A0A6A4S1E0_SCOMX|nr:hypothetical protein F2P81_020812 [Scophthalmus maximus]
MRPTSSLCLQMEYEFELTMSKGSQRNESGPHSSQLQALSRIASTYTPFRTSTTSTEWIADLRGAEQKNS